MGRLRVVSREIPSSVPDSYAAINAAVELAVEEHTPGIELAAASRTSNFTTTNTDLTSSAGSIPSFSLTLVGQGRPVDLRFFAAKAYHSVASTTVNALIVVNAVALSANNQIGSARSSSTTDGPSLTIQRRTGVLTAGVTYGINVWVAGAAAGTCTLVGANHAPIELTATSR